MAAIGLGSDVAAGWVAGKQGRPVDPHLADLESVPALTEWRRIGVAGGSVVGIVAQVRGSVRQVESQQAEHVGPI